MKFKILYISALLTYSSLFSQDIIELKAVFDTNLNQVHIDQHISYFNKTNDTLKVIYLNDWSNSYSTKKTPLALRFAEEFNNKFHFAESNERGFTAVTSVLNNTGETQNFSRLKEHPDVLKIELSNPLIPNSSYKLSLKYIVQLPSDKFTRYGVSPLGDYNLKYWYLTPAVYDGKWHYFSNKNLDDQYIPKATITMQLEIPRNFVVTTELDLIDIDQNSNTQTLVYTGNDRVDSKLFLHKFPIYKTVQTDHFTLISNFTKKELSGTDRAMITDKIVQFTTKYLGSYPHQKLIVSDIDAKKDPIYGLNQLPEFIRPFPKHFQFEIQLLKNILGNYLDNTLLINPRKEHWLKDGIQTYLMIKYIEEYYPDMKLLGSFANVWGIRSFHAADLKFNEMYTLVYLHMARTNRDQPLTTSKDSLLKFNSDLANKYKAGVGFKYLDDFVNANIIEDVIKELLDKKKLQSTTPSDFEAILKSKTSKNVDWFFKDYVQSNSKIDFKIKKVSKTEDSITLTIKNKRENTMPVSLFTLNNDSITSKAWIENIKGNKTITIPRNNANKLVLNKDNAIPEYILRDNWKSLKGFPANNKPLQLRLFKDIEDPSKTQAFLMPLLEYRNIYDGLVLGTKFYNKTVLRRGFVYKFTPTYGTKSRSFNYGASLSYTQNIENKDLYTITYGLTAKKSSYGPDLFARVISPYVTYNFRDHTDYRSNKFQALNFRYLDIKKDQDILGIAGEQDPAYSVFNARWINTNPGLIDYYRWFTDFQLSKDFGKFSFNYEYRKLYESNRQLNLRFFFGSFLYNDTPINDDYFSFALDRPTDYLFDYNYLGRSEASGIFSQQIIIAEGGFKSKLDTPFANQWMATTNVSTSIWRYIQAYADFGLVKNKFEKAKFQYDSGIRIDLVTDYFEVYFPVYSNLGWEIGQPNYDEKIRFVFTADPKSLLGLFRRKWY